VTDDGHCEPLTDAEILEVFRETHALLDGHFLLRSGLHSRQYFQCALVLQYPRLAERLCRQLADKLKAFGAETVISPAMGGLFIGHEVARALNARHIFVEKNSSGKLELRRSFQIRTGEKLIVVEDVVTKGGRVKETMDIVRSRGGEVVGGGALVDRTTENLNLGVPLQSLLKWHIETFKPEECPLCKSGATLLKPGS